MYEIIENEKNIIHFYYNMYLVKRKKKAVKSQDNNSKF